MVHEEPTSRRAVLERSGVALAAVAGSSLMVGSAAGAKDVPLEPTFSLVTDPASDVNTTYATLNGDLESLGGADSARVWFRWRRLSGSDNLTAEQTFHSSTTYSATVTGLAPGVTYEFRAEGESSEPDIDSGSYHTFTTPR